jgi:hypothetical protein
VGQCSPACLFACLPAHLPACLPDRREEAAVAKTGPGEKTSHLGMLFLITRNEKFCQQLVVPKGMQQQPTSISAFKFEQILRTQNFVESAQIDKPLLLPTE